MNSVHLAVADATLIPIDDPIASHRPRGVRVHAIGPLRVSLGRFAIQSLGGQKAGTNQAAGLFGFLFDRGPRGLEKDEAIELIWPDAPLGGADMAFHRTLLGLRGTLRGGGFADAVELRNGRYILASGLISWSDTTEVERLIDRSASAADPADRIGVLEECRRLNTADYMDDCPFFGTSAFAEPRRVMLREVRQAVLVELSELYAAAGHRALAAVRRAEARMVSSDGDGVEETATVRLPYPALSFPPAPA